MSRPSVRSSAAASASASSAERRRETGAGPGVPSASPALLSSAEIFDERGFVRVCDGEVKVFPIEMATFKTIDFREDGCDDGFLSSGLLNQCPLLVMKNFNPATGKYDNIVTAAHFLPSCAFDEETAKRNIGKMVDSFIDKGGELNERTSVILIAGGIHDSIRDLSATARGKIERVLMAEDSPLAGCKLNLHKGSINNLNQTTVVSVGSEGTQIVKMTNRGESDISFELLTRPLPSLAERTARDLFLETGSFAKSHEYGRLSFFRKQTAVAEMVAAKRPASLIDMDDVISEHRALADSSEWSAAVASMSAGASKRGGRS